MATNTFDDLAREIAKEIKNHAFGNPVSISSDVSWDDISTGRLFTQNVTNQSSADQYNAPGPGRWVGFTNTIFASYKIQVAWIVSVTQNARVTYRGWASSTGWSSWIDIGGTSAFYDSGLRDISSLVTDTSIWDTDRIVFRAQRVGPHVDIFLSGMIYSGSETGQVAVFTLPNGWRPPASVYGNTMRNNSMYMTTSGLLRITNPATILDYGHLSYVTRDNLPTAPLGTNG